MKKTNILWGIFFVASSVFLGAMNAHYLKKFFTPDLTASFETGVRYQMYHGLALLFLSLATSYFTQRQLKIGGILMIIGTILFSWSIYFLCMFKSNGLIGLKGLGALTPIGGLVLLAAWFFLFISVIRQKNNVPQ